MLKLGNFLDYRPTELLRGVTVALDFRLAILPANPAPSTDTEALVPIAILSSDIQFAIAIGYDNTRSLHFTAIMSFQNGSPPRWASVNASQRFQFFLPNRDFL